MMSCLLRVIRAPIFVRSYISWHCNFTRVIVEQSERATAKNFLLTRICVHHYSKKSAKSAQKALRSDSLDLMKKEKDAFYVVRKGDIVGVYNNLNECQAQVRSSISDPPISVFKGYSLCEETVNYLSLFGLRSAIYSLKATDLKDDLFGNLVPCTFHEAAVPDEIKNCLKSSCILEVDGASKGNPGKAGAGVILRDSTGKLICKLREGLGNTTCNVAEYRATILGLKIALERGYTHIRVQSDSKLVCMQMQGLWKSKNEKLSKLNEMAKTLKGKFSSFEMTHVQRMILDMVDYVCFPRLQNTPPPWSRLTTWKETLPHCLAHPTNEHMPKALYFSGLNSEADEQANLGTKLTDGEIQQEDDIMAA